MPRRRRTTRRSSGSGRRSSRKGSPSYLLIGILFLSLTALGGSIYLLIQEKNKNSPQASIREKAEQLALENPDAEVIYEPTERDVKKK